MKEDKLTREQRRHFERIKKEVDFQYAKLASSFFDYFIDNDPESIDVLNKEKEVIRKWKMYCGKMRLNPEIFDAMKKHCDEVRKDYKSQEA